MVPKPYVSKNGPKNLRFKGQIKKNTFHLVVEKRYLSSWVNWNIRKKNNKIILNLKLVWENKKNVLVKKIFLLIFV